LHTEGVLLINNDSVVDLFPKLGMPGAIKSGEPDPLPDRTPATDDAQGRDSCTKCPPPKSPKL